MIQLISLSRKRTHHQLIAVNRIISICCLSFILVFLISCGSKKPRIVTTKKQARTHRIKSSKSDQLVNNHSSEMNQVVKNAKSYLGTKYQYGGSTKKGMDCSGLIHVAFKEAGQAVPRTSKSLYDTSKKVSLDRIRKGDLLFFATGKKNKVNHVGLVTQRSATGITFIHASSSRGVMQSSLNEMYWVNVLVSAGRIP